MDLTTRDIAAAVWLGALALWAARSSAVRSSVRGLLRLIAGPLAMLLIAYTLYIAAGVALAAYAGTWGQGSPKTVLAWYVLTGLGLLINSSRTASEEHSYRRAILRAAGLTACVELLVGARTFPLPVELVLVPLATFLPLLALFAGDDPKGAPVKRLASRTTAALGLLVLGWTALGLVGSDATIDVQGVALEYSLPVWLTVWALPFVFGFELWSTYESAFGQINRFARDAPGTRRRAKAALFTSFWLRKGELRAFQRGEGLTELARARSWREARQILAFHRAEVGARRATERLERARLARYAGVPGTDWEGRPHDEREFADTKEALYTIAAVHRAQFARGRYRRDVMALASGLLPKGVPDAEITMRMGRGARAWAAWRRTVGGWWLGIGAIGTGDDTWAYLGETEPAGLPGNGGGWTRGDFPIVTLGPEDDTDDQAPAA